MDVSRWDIERLLRLPDWCFGRRYVVSCYVQAAPGTTVWDMSEVSFPDVGVLWELQILPVYITDPGDYVRVALGGQVPADAATFMTLGPLVMGLGKEGAEPREIHFGMYSGSLFIRGPFLIRAQGQRMVVEGRATATKYCYCSVVAVVSPMPEEVPDWVVSGPAKSPW